MKSLLISSILFFSLSSFAQSENDQALSFMSYMSSQIVHRPLNATETSALRTNGRQAFRSIAESWFLEASFQDSAQQFVETLIMASGTLDGVDYSLPGYLGRDIARRRRPYAEIIRASTCVNKDGNSIACDTGAPYSAGLLTTRAYLASTKGAYNIARASKMIKRFLCTEYPLPEVEEPRLTTTELIPQFATTAGTISFGNGNNCYSCHSQFGHHTQFFVKFDLNGVYTASANGIQNPAATDGFSQNGLATSHLSSPARAGQESSRILGRPAANLREAAVLITQSSRFLPCAAKNLMKHYLRLSDQNLDTVKADLYQRIALDARALQSEPSLSHLLTAIITNPAVFESFRNSGAQP